MKLIRAEEYEEYADEVATAIVSGKIFIYPTDTIYGIGCDASCEEGVRKIRELKQRDTKPFSVIAPGKEWISRVCQVREGKELDRLPGPYTLIMNMIDTTAVASNVNPGISSLGVRIPDHWFTKVVASAGVPFVTTSVNISGEKHMECLEELPATIASGVDYIIYEGEKKGESSIKIDLT